MTGRKRFFLNGIMLTLVALAVRSVGMAFNSYITKTVGAEGIGLYTLIMTVYSFAITFATSGISLTVTRLVASAIGEGKAENVGKIMRHSIIYSLIFSSAASLTLIFGAEYFGLLVLGDERTVLPLRILGVSLVPLALSSVFGGYFIGVRHVARNAFLQVISQVFKICVTLFFVLRYAKYGVAYAASALCISATVTELVCFAFGFIQYLLDRRKAAGGKSGGAPFADVLSMALPLALSQYIRSALLTIEHILIPKRLRSRGDSVSESLSAYGILHGMALPMLIFPMAPLSSFSGLLVPEFSESLAKSDYGRMERMAKQAMNATLTYAVAVSVILAVFSEEIGYCVYDSYGAGYYIALMAPVIPIMYLDHVADSMLKGIGEQVYSMWVNISDSLLSVFLVWILIPKMGIGGYAVVIVLMEGFNFLLSVLRLRKRIRFSVDLKKSFLLPLACAFASALLTKKLFIMNGKEASVIFTLSKLLFAAAVFLGLYALIKRIFLKRGLKREPV